VPQAGVPRAARCTASGGRAASGRAFVAPVLVVVVVTMCVRAVVVWRLCVGLRARALRALKQDGHEHALQGFCDPLPLLGALSHSCRHRVSPRALDRQPVCCCVALQVELGDAARVHICLFGVALHLGEQDGLGGAAANVGLQARPKVPVVCVGVSRAAAL